MPPLRQFRAAGRNLSRIDLTEIAPRAAEFPLTVQILLENVARTGGEGDGATLERLASYDPRHPPQDVPFRPTRVLLQDFTGVPVVADLAALRDAVAEAGGDPAAVDPAVPVELVIDHSVVAEVARRPDALEQNLRIEHERNAERYRFLRWGQQAFDRFTVFPPGAGICHQVNLERLARVVMVGADDLAHPDTVLGTDSHTPMVNGIGVLGWGVGGIEAEAAMLGVPVPLGEIRVVGLRLSGGLREGVTATDLVLTITELLRQRGVVGAFLEVIGPGLATLSVEDRATISNMSPEFGSTTTLFPIDGATLRYLEVTGREADHVALVEAYAKEQGLWAHQAPPDAFAEVIDLDLAGVEPSLAGPSRPQDRIPLARLRRVVRSSLGQSVELRPGTVNEASSESFPASDPPAVAGVAPPEAEPGPATQSAPALEPAARLREAEIRLGAESVVLRDGALVIAAITSCTNTSNPAVMLAAGLVAKAAVEAGLTVPPWVKTSLAPGSPVVIDYLERAGLLTPLEQLGFHLVGLGCTTCIGNSGPLAPEVSEAIRRADLSVAAVLSGNRNFEGRIHPEVKLNFLASPPLVVALALAGTADLDPTTDPLGRRADGAPVRLADLWPTSAQIQAARAGITPEAFRARYAGLAEGDQRWRQLGQDAGDRYAWDDASTYIRRPPFLDPGNISPVVDIQGARVLALLGDSVTTDHISPAGVIRPGSPAARWLEDHGVAPGDFSSYGARRGNHEVMVRGTFANIRLRNLLLPGSEGGVSVHHPSGEVASIYEVAERYRAEGTPLVVLAGEGYGAGSSRDWAAKGTALLGVRAVIARSFERIHRSNLIGMGVVPLQFLEGESAGSLGLDGSEVITVRGLSDLVASGVVPATVTVEAGGSSFQARPRIDSPSEIEQLRAGGLLPLVMRLYER